MIKKNFDIYLDIGSSKIRAAGFEKNDNNQIFFLENNCLTPLKINQLDLSITDKILEKTIHQIEKKTGEYGILIGDKLSWGKGFAKEASIRIIKYCFQELKLTMVTLGVIEDNFKAVSLYKKIGFSIYEKNTDIGLYNNKLSNGLRMSIHKDEF